VTGSLISSGTRQRVRDLATPIATSLGRLGLTPNALTLIGFLGTCVAAVAAAYQWWLVAGLLVLVFGIFDLFDGTLARATGRATRLGAFLDSTFDRTGEGIVYLGVMAGLQATGFADGFIYGAAAMLAAFMVSYTRAKAESLGFTTGTGMAAIGLMPREVRVAVLAVGLVLAGALGTGPVSSVGETGGAGGAAFPLGILALEASLALIAIGATITVIQRILHVRAQAGRPNDERSSIDPALS
jgi:CDP-diacylglycerol---glycerol-3-phosphate 3-phosphatidyltransferase